MTYLWSKRFFFIGCCVSLLSFLIISSRCYLKIYISLRHQQAQVHGFQFNPCASLNIARYKKTVFSALCIQCNTGVVLSTLYYCNCCQYTAWNYYKYYYCLEYYRNTGFSQLISKPSTLLLENKRSKTSSKGDYKAMVMPIKTNKQTNNKVYFELHFKRND